MSHDSGVSSRMVRSLMFVPALFTSTSTRPNALVAASMSFALVGLRHVGGNSPERIAGVRLPGHARELGRVAAGDDNLALPSRRVRLHFPTPDPPPVMTATRSVNLAIAGASWPLACEPSSLCYCLTTRAAGRPFQPS